MGVEEQNLFKINIKELLTSATRKGKANHPALETSLYLTLISS